MTDQPETPPSPLAILNTHLERKGQEIEQLTAQLRALRQVHADIARGEQALRTATSPAPSSFFSGLSTPEQEYVHAAETNSTPPSRADVQQPRDSWRKNYALVAHELGRSESAPAESLVDVIIGLRADYNMVADALGYGPGVCATKLVEAIERAKPSEASAEPIDWVDLAFKQLALTGQRFGQALFLVVEQHRPDIADQIRATKYDPFHAEAGSARLTRALDKIEELSKTPPKAPTEQAEQVRPESLPGAEPQWVVNNLGELGVVVNGEAFFLYKGRSLNYEDKNMLMRPVGKCEFGETCTPPGFDGKTYIEGDGWCTLPELCEQFDDSSEEAT